MPELPEVETIRRYLEKTIIGKTIHSLEVLYPNSFSGNASDCEGLRIISLSRNGKVLHIALSNVTFLNIHLKMSGQLLYAPDSQHAVFPVQIPLATSGAMPARTTRVIIHFSDGSALFFNDLRKFGWIRHTKQTEGTTAPDPVKKQLSLEHFTNLVAKTRQPVKTFLLDQEKIAGLGNIYANDALFVAKILPSRLTFTLTASEIKHLYSAIHTILEKGVLYKGTSASAVYVLPDGSKGSYQEHFLVYKQEGKPCPICGTPIRREKERGRSNFWCPVCQK